MADDKTEDAKNASRGRGSTRPSSTPPVLDFFRIDIFSLFAIFCAAITLMSNLEPLIKLAGWARVLASHWNEVTTWCWGRLFALVGWKVPSELVPPLTLMFFVVATALAARITAPRNGGSFRASMHERIISSLDPVVLTTLTIMWIMTLLAAVRRWIFYDVSHFSGAAIVFMFVMSGAASLQARWLTKFYPMKITKYDWISYTGLSVLCLIFILPQIDTVRPLMGKLGVPVSAVILPLIAISVVIANVIAPQGALIRRLCWVLAVTFGVIVLSVFSQLGLTVESFDPPTQ